MKPLRTYDVRPVLPERIRRLDEIAASLWWEWDYDALSLFLRLDRDLWERSGHNPVRMLGQIPQEALDALARDEGFAAQYDRVCEAWDAYRTDRTWFDAREDVPKDMTVAYFSFEFGLTECVPLYSGGLGILAGDTIKAASDLGLPLVGVGILYQQGYFRQYLNNDGWQGERYPDNDFYTMPVRLERRRTGQPVVIQVEYPSGPVFAQVWSVTVGRNRIYMLDTNIESNKRREDRTITDQLYGGDIENRIRQEILLGVGGLRALDAIGVRPAVCHLNEGHSAFLSLERIRRRMVEDHLTFDEAREATRVGNVFTTHTPVPAGNEAFPTQTLERYIRSILGDVKAPVEKIIDIGRLKPGASGEGLGMTVLAIHMSDRVNAVSQLHGAVARKMWSDLWPQTPVEEIPILSITNGVHLPSWVSHDMADLFERYIGPAWRRDAGGADLWKHIRRIPNEEIWRTHERRRERLVGFARRHLKQTLMKRRANLHEIAKIDEALDPEALTIVFARRFATYKRGALLLRDIERFRRLLSDRDRPIQIIFAGKAHPHDAPGKEVIREIVHVARSEDFRSRVIFLEDYDMQIARYLVEGADVWLNTPRRPLEASGTSGMKAAANGALNVSILDGWYDEAHREHPEIGWAIGSGEEYSDHEYQDQVECDALYNILEQEVIPLFYSRGRGGLPREWIERMKEAMIVACSFYNVNRMLREYAESMYFPTARKRALFKADGWRRAGEMSQWSGSLRAVWDKIRIEQVIADGTGELGIGQTINVRARVRLGPVRPEDVRVEIYHGEVDAANEIRSSRRIEMNHVRQASAGGGRTIDGVHDFIGGITTAASGHFGYSIRILPRHEDLTSPFVPGLIVWSKGE